MTNGDAMGATRRGDAQQLSSVGDQVRDQPADVVDQVDVFREASEAVRGHPLRRLWVSGRDNSDAGRASRAGLVPDHDLDILVEDGEQRHQAFNREPGELVVP
jgi:hypothetical protein